MHGWNNSPEKWTVLLKTDMSLLDRGHIEVKNRFIGRENSRKRRIVSLIYPYPAENRMNLFYLTGMGAQLVYMDFLSVISTTDNPSEGFKLENV